MSAPETFEERRRRIQAEAHAAWGMPPPVDGRVDPARDRIPVAETLTWKPGRGIPCRAVIEVLHRDGRWGFCASVSMRAQGCGWGAYPNHCPPHPSRAAALAAAVDDLDDRIQTGSGTGVCLTKECVRDKRKLLDWLRTQIDLPGKETALTNDIAEGGAVPDEVLPAGEPEERLTQRFLQGYEMIAGGAFACGEALLDAKEQLGHGQWEAWVRERLPVSPRTAQQFMAIARDPNLLRARREEVKSESLTRICLPASWTTLYQLTGLEADRFDALVEAGKIHPEMTRADVKAALAEDRHRDPPPLKALPAGRYRAILADPPWPFETYGAAGKGRSAEQHYPTMTLEAIEMLPVMDVAADDSLLFLWITSDSLVHAARIMHQWGFELVSTAFVWVKPGAPGLGYWTRKGAELCLLGKRGSPKRQAADVYEVIRAPRGLHSAKPPDVYGAIERLVAGPYLELFAREPRPGWSSWGNDPALGATEPPA